MELYTCTDLMFSYENRVAVRNLTFGIRDGMFLAIVGENGSGKSTLLKGLLGLLKPTSGKLVRNVSPKAVGYLPQQTAIQKDFPASVSEVVLSGTQNNHPWLPFYTAADRKRADEALERVGMLAQKNACYRQLSGGQQQRVLLARALCAATDVLFLDEPVTALDPVATDELYAVLRDLHRNGMTVVMVSHDLKGALSCADHILHLHGSHSFFGTAEDYLQSSCYRAFGGREDCV